MRLFFEIVGAIALCALIAYAIADLNERGIGPRRKKEDDSDG